jgi:hypothetical protein
LAGLLEPTDVEFERIYQLFPFGSTPQDVLFAKLYELNNVDGCQNCSSSGNHCRGVHLAELFLVLLARLCGEKCIPANALGFLGW